MFEEYHFATFKSTHDALMFDKEALQRGIDTIIMPVPRNISSSCGLAIRFNIEDLNKIKKMVEEERLTIESHYVVKTINNERVIKLYNINE